MPMACLSGCAAIPQEPVGAVAWDRFALEGEHPSARLVPFKWIEGADRKRWIGWLSKQVGPTGAGHRGGVESIQEATVISAGDATRLVQTRLEGVAGLESVLRVVREDRVLGTLENVEPTALLELGSRRFVLVAPSEEDGAQRPLFELTDQRVLAAGHLLVPAPKQP
jgi:hypothetical protein